MTGFCEISTYNHVEQEYTTVDAYAQYGIVFEKGTYEALFPLPSPKPRYEYDWGGEHGIEIDEFTPTVLAATQVTLPIVIISNNEADFLSKYMAFRTLILGKPDHSVYVDFIFLQTGRRFKLRYTGGATLSILGTVRGSRKVGMRFRLNFSDDFPRTEPLLPASVFDEMTFDDIILD